MLKLNDRSRGLLRGQDHLAVELVVYHVSEPARLIMGERLTMPRYLSPCEVVWTLNPPRLDLLSSKLRT